MVTTKDVFKAPYYKQLIGMIERLRRREVKKVSIEDDNLRMSVYMVGENKIRIDLTARSEENGG